MGKTILILNGSPRKNGNTSALVEAFARGAIGTTGWNSISVGRAWGRSFAEG